MSTKSGIKIVKPGTFFKPPVSTNSLKHVSTNSLKTPGNSLSRSIKRTPISNGIGFIPPNLTKKYVWPRGTPVWIKKPIDFDESSDIIETGSTFGKIVSGQKLYKTPVYYFGPSTIEDESIFTKKINSHKGSKIPTKWLKSVESNPPMNRVEESDDDDDSDDNDDDFDIDLKDYDNDNGSDDEYAEAYDLPVNRKREREGNEDMYLPKKNLVITFNPGTAYRINDTNCSIEFSFSLYGDTLTITQFICPGGGKELLRDTLEALSTKYTFNDVELIPHNFDPNKFDAKLFDPNIFIHMDHQLRPEIMKAMKIKKYIEKVKGKYKFTQAYRDMRKYIKKVKGKYKFTPAYYDLNQTKVDENYNKMGLYSNGQSGDDHRFTGSKADILARLNQFVRPNLGGSRKTKKTKRRQNKKTTKKRKQNGNKRRQTKKRGKR
jgi:hypothetical protein